jgi:hypothetical protein
MYPFVAPKYTIVLLALGFNKICLVKNSVSDISFSKTRNIQFTNNNCTQIVH